MFSNKRKTIGVILEAVFLEFANEVSKGIIQEAEDNGYNVALFCLYGQYANNFEFSISDRKILDLVPYEDLDGLVILTDTILQTPTKEYALSLVKERCTCPVVSIREAIEGFHNILIDCKASITNMTEHFIRKHHFKKLAFMTGMKGRWDAEERLEAFLETMKKHDLPVSQRQIFYGDFWYNMGDDACDWFLGGDETPEAILCANDHMAIALARALSKRGYSVPKDISISGFDGLKQTLLFSPSITTTEIPCIAMGQKAVQLILDSQNTPLEPADYYFDATVRAMESCGCLTDDSEAIITVRQRHFDNTSVLENRQLQFDFFSTYLGEASTLENVANKIERYIPNIDNCVDYCICLCNQLLEDETYSDFSETMELRLAYHDHRSLGDLNIPFPTRNLLPAKVLGKEPQTWFFSALHFGSNLFGYEAYRFGNPENTGNLNFSWSVIINNALQNVIINNKLQGLLQELQSMSITDPLTGLLNRRGLESQASRIFYDAKLQKNNILLAVIDLDGMKHINDNYGHSEGDFALQKVRDAFHFCCKKDVLCARTGGDEFVILASNIAPDAAEHMLHSILGYLETFNDMGRKPYKIHASFGVICKIPNPLDSLETFMKESDELMYENKVTNKKKRGEKLR